MCIESSQELESSHVPSTWIYFLFYLSKYSKYAGDMNVCTQFLGNESNNRSRKKNTNVNWWDWRGKAGG